MNLHTFFTFNFNRFKGDEKHYLLQMEKRLLKALIIAIAMLPMFSFSLFGRDVKIVVEPENARIHIDGQYYGDGTVKVKAPKKGDFISVRAECQGYKPLNVKIYGTDKRKAISYKLQKDNTLEYFNETALGNKFFTVNVNSRYYDVNENGKVDTEVAWKLMHQILLNYFEEIQTSDIVSGFIQTPWKLFSFDDLDHVFRTRVTVKQSSLGEALSYQIKISLEYTEVGGSYWKECNFISKDLEPMISEFQSRLGQ